MDKELVLVVLLVASEVEPRESLEDRSAVDVRLAHQDPQEMLERTVVTARTVSLVPTVNLVKTHLTLIPKDRRHLVYESVLLDLLELPARLEKRDLGVTLVKPESLVLLESPARKDLPANLVPQVLLVIQEDPAKRARMENLFLAKLQLVHPEELERWDLLDHPVHLELRDSLESPEHPVHEVTKETQDHTVKQEVRGPLDRTELLESEAAANTVLLQGHRQGTKELSLSLYLADFHGANTKNAHRVFPVLISLFRCTFCTYFDSVWPRSFHFYNIRFFSH